MKQWRKTSYSANDSNCVEMACDGAVMGIRDSKRPSAGHLTLPVASVDAFLALAKATRPN